MIVVITGTSRGLGKYLFNKIAEYNIRLLAISRCFCDDQKDKTRLNNLVTLVSIDFSYPESIYNLISKQNILDTEEIIFINNASIIGEIKEIGRFSKEESIINAINVNFTSPILLFNFFAQKAKKLFIINISSGAAHHPIDKWGLYCSTKSAMKSFLDVCNMQDNIEVNNIDPGVMDTEMQNSIRKSEFRGVENFTKLKKDGKLQNPKDVADRIFNCYIKDRIN